MQVLTDVKSILDDAGRASGLFLRRPVCSARAFWLKYHLPLLLASFLAYLLAPIRIYADGFSAIFAFEDALFFVFVCMAFLILAMTYDKIQEIRPPVLLPGISEGRNLSLFFHLPVSAAGIFAFLHPLLGLLMIFLFALLSITWSVLAQADFREKSLLQAVTDLVSAGVLLFIPVLLLLFALNIVQTMQIWKVLN